MIPIQLVVLVVVVVLVIVSDLIVPAHTGRGYDASDRLPAAA
jgi:hypothetical protein